MAISVLITGGLGFLGSAISEVVKERHPEWIMAIMDLNGPKTPKHGVHYLIGDVTDDHTVETIMMKTKPNVVIHTAGLIPKLETRYGRKDRARVFDINVNGTQVVLRAARKHRVQAFVWTGSFTCMTDNMEISYANMDESWPVPSRSLVYGESKTAAEAFVLAASDSSFATCALRPSVIFGPGDYQLIPSLHACIAKGETPFIIGEGMNLWDITYVTNVAEAHILAAENLLSSKTAAGEAIFISNEEPVPFRDICLAVWKEFGHFPPFQIHVPKRLAALAGFASEWITWLTGAPTTFSRGSVMEACSTRYCSGLKARMILGYAPRVRIEEGIRISCKEYAKRLKEKEHMPVNQEVTLERSTRDGD